MKQIKLNKEKCTGCRVCELTCSVCKYGEFNVNSAHCRVTYSEVLPVGPVFCKQCKNAMCSNKCPQGAIMPDEKTGLLKVSRDKCTKCGICVSVCPFNAMFIDGASGYPVKCDQCDGNPKCVIQCPAGALEYI